MRKVLAVGACAALMSLVPGVALASEPEIGPCNEPDSIVVRVGQYAKICVLVPPIDQGG